MKELKEIESKYDIKLNISGELFNYLIRLIGYNNIYLHIEELIKLL